MPKRTADRSISDRGEKNLARRIAHERGVRGWSYETLAKKMTAAGCPISKAALYGIEQGDPPRRITVDELMAFAEIFTEGDAAELLVPVGALDRRAVHMATSELHAARKGLEEAVSTSIDALEVLTEISRRDPDLYEYAGHLMRSMYNKDPYATSLFAVEDERPDRLDAVWLLELRAQNAVLDFWGRLGEIVADWLDYAEGKWSHEQMLAIRSEVEKLSENLGWDPDVRLDDE